MCCRGRATTTATSRLPRGAQRTLDRRAGSLPWVYSLDELEAGRTHDPFWNAAQMWRVLQGRLTATSGCPWGKKILEWSASRRGALTVMIGLNNQYALDGHDPNSCSRILWVLGRYERPGRPERAIFGTRRDLSSESAARKVRARECTRRYAP